MKPPVPTDLGWRGYGGPWGARCADGDAPRRWGIGLFIVSLAALFIASLIAYAVIRHQGPGASVHVELPVGLWYSTAVLLFFGGAVWMAQRAGRNGQMHGIRNWVIIAWMLSVAFLAVQTPSLIRLSESFRALDGEFRAEGLVMVLILLHALHVIGGLIPLSLLAWRLLRERISPVEISWLRSCAAYWHFLEAVWIVMFATLLLVR
jgi:heme/copper-type cytochrome/quinol oxidase subunit 3